MTNQITTLTENEQIKLVVEIPNMIQYISNPSEIVQLAAVKQNGVAIRFINGFAPSEAVLLELVKQIINS